MLNKSAYLIASLLLSGAAFAEPESIGKVVEVEGLVTVSDGVRVSAVALGGLVADDTHYVTSSTGSVTLKFDNGCELKLKPNQSVMVHRQACELLLASVVGGGNPIAGVGLGIVGAGLLGVAGVGLLGSISNSPISGQ